MANRFSGLAQLTGAAAKLRISAAIRSAPAFAARPAVSFSPQAAFVRAFHSSQPSLAKAKVAPQTELLQVHGSRFYGFEFGGLGGSGLGRGVYAPHDTCPLVRLTDMYRTASMHTQHAVSRGRTTAFLPNTLKLSRAVPICLGQCPREEAAPGAGEWWG